MLQFNGHWLHIYRSSFLVILCSKCHLINFAFGFCSLKCSLNKGSESFSHGIVGWKDAYVQHLGSSKVTYVFNYWHKVMSFTQPFIVPDMQFILDYEKKIMYISPSFGFVTYQPSPQKEPNKGNSFWPPKGFELSSTIQLFLLRLDWFLYVQLLAIGDIYQIH